MLLSDIPTETFNQILADLRSEGWQVVSEYDGVDAGIDYGKVVLSKDTLCLVFEWDNWFEGSIEGDAAFVQELQNRYTLK